MPSDDGIALQDLKAMANKKNMSIGQFVEDLVHQKQMLSVSGLLQHGADETARPLLDEEWNPKWMYPHLPDGLTENPEFKNKRYREWFDGMPEELRKGVSRPKPFDSHDEGDTHDAPPAYYAESSYPVRVAKAFVMALTTIVPYFTIFDSLSVVEPETWIPCSNHTCHYIRIFNSENLPGTGSNVMAVENGIERPVALNYFHFDVYSCGLNKDPNNTRTTVEKLKFWTPNGSTCPNPCHECAHQGHDNSMTAEVIKDEQNAAKTWTKALKLSFWMTKSVFWAASVPLNWLAKPNAKWGMEHVPSGRCPGFSADHMRNVCDKIETKREVVNHLKTWGPSKYIVYAGLVGYALLQAIHDLILMAFPAKERLTLPLGAAATGCIGMSCAAVFMWAMGATEVFVAPVPGFSTTECMCYYQLPELTALLGLATPFALYAVFRAQVQMRGLACLYGDYLSWITFIIPHYLARQSFLWTWGTLVTPKAAGTLTTAEAKRPRVKSWGLLRNIQYTLYTGSNILGVVVAFSASSFMISFKEVCVSMYKKKTYSPFVRNAIKYVLLPLPTIAIYGIAGYAFMELYYSTIGLDPCERMIGQFKVLLPGCISYFIPDNLLRGNKGTPDWKTRYFCFAVGAILLGGFTAAAGQGLSPNLSFLLDFKGETDLEWTSLAQAELWSASGFIFFLIHVPRVLTIAFSTWDDLESLKRLQENSEKKSPNSNVENQNMYMRVENQNP
jgi:hypothetical protein